MKLKEHFQARRSCKPKGLFHLTQVTLNCYTLIQRNNIFNSVTAINICLIIHVLRININLRKGFVHVTYQLFYITLLPVSASPRQCSFTLNVVNSIANLSANTVDFNETRSLSFLLNRNVSRFFYLLFCRYSRLHILCIADCKVLCYT